MTDIRSTLAREGFVRSEDGRLLGGVCAGIGRRFGLTPWIARLLLVVLSLVLPGSLLLLYPVLWILMPSEDAVTVRAHTSRPHLRDVDGNISRNADAPPPVAAGD